MTQHHVVALADGTRLGVDADDPGGRPVLVLLQGQAGAGSWWADLRRRFDDRFRTVTLDQRGTGSTLAPPGDFSTALLAEDVVGALDALGVDRAHVYGTSMGGRVAQVLAARHPDRVASLVLAATSPGGPQAVERSTAVRRALADVDPVRRLGALVGLFYTPAWGTDPSRSRLLGDPTMTVADRQRHLRASARHDAWDLLPSVAAPTLVLHGSEDAMAPVRNAHLIAARVPQARLHVHEGGRHGFFDEFADDLDPVLDAFWTASGVPGRMTG